MSANGKSSLTLFLGPVGLYGQEQELVVKIKSNQPGRHPAVLAASYDEALRKVSALGWHTTDTKTAEYPYTKVINLER